MDNVLKKDITDEQQSTVDGQQAETDKQQAEAAAFRFEAAAFGIAVLAYAALCLSVLRHSVIWLLGYVADDAFYYLQVARHLALNGQSTFDGINPTNGYHPGWMLLMTACARLIPDKAALLKTSLGLEFGFHLATSLILIPIMRRLAGLGWAWLIAAVWLLNPLPFRLALFGVEAPFAQFTLTVCVWVFLTRIAPFLRRGTDFQPPVQNLWLLGGSLALAFYGRTDQLLLTVVFLPLLLRLIWICTAPNKRGQAAIRALLGIGSAFVLGILPWYAFSYAACGTLSQDSGAMKMLWHAHSISGWNIHTLLIAPLRFVAFSWLAAPFAALLTGTFLPGTFSAHSAVTRASLLGLGLVAGALWWTARSSPRSLTGGKKSRSVETYSVETHSAETHSAETYSAETTLLTTLTVWLGGAYLLSGLFYGVLVDDPQFWHLAIPSLTLFLVLNGWAAHEAGQRLAPRSQRRLGAGLLLIALGLCAWQRSQMAPPYPWQRDVYTSQPRFETLIPASARIGCFDAGIPAYFSPRTVINLDGLVNHTAVPYWKAGALDRYVAAQGIGYIANEPATVEHAQGFTTAPIPLALIASAPLRGWSTGRRCLWKVGGSSEHSSISGHPSGSGHPSNKHKGVTKIFAPHIFVTPHIFKALPYGIRDFR